jgi:hypothetical protein
VGCPARAELMVALHSTDGGNGERTPQAPNDDPRPTAFSPFSTLHAPSTLTTHTRSSGCSDSVMCASLGLSPPNFTMNFDPQVHMHIYLISHSLQQGWMVARFHLSARCTLIGRSCWIRLHPGSAPEGHRRWGLKHRPDRPQLAQ